VILALAGHTQGGPTQGFDSAPRAYCADDFHMTMFAKLPQTLAAPFGLLTDEAKLAFRSRPQGISKLYTMRVSLYTRFHFDFDYNDKLSTAAYSRN
jgi:hypothetical protein